MDRLALFLAAVLPALTILAASVAKARADWRNEALWTAFFLGGVAAVAVAVAAAALSALGGRLPSLEPLPAAALRALLSAALPEETAKFAVLVMVAVRHVDARRRQDVIPLAVAVALGFAALENLFYLVEAEDWQARAVMRALTAVPGHGVDGVVMGALLTRARLSPVHLPPARPVPSWRGLALAVAVPVALHAAYDFPPMARDNGVSQSWLPMLWVAVMAGTAVLAAVLSSRALTAAARLDGEVAVPSWGNAAVALALLVAAGSSCFWGLSRALTAEAADWAALVFLSVAVAPLILGIDLLWWCRPGRLQAERGGSR